MAYYIKYPKSRTAKVAVVKKSPRISKKYGWAEGSFRTKKEVSKRLNWMDIPAKRRPRGF